MVFPCSLVDGGGLRTFLCDPMHTLRSSGYTLSGIYIDDLSWSLRTKLPENAFPQPLNTFSGKFQLGDQFISLIYTIPHTNSWASAGVHTLAKKSCFSSLFGSHPPDYIVNRKVDKCELSLNNMQSETINKQTN